MNRARSVIALLAAIVTFASWSFAKDKPSDQEGVAILAKAVSLQDIGAQGSQPFQLRLHIHAEHIVPKPMDGEYAEVWIAPNA